MANPRRHVAAAIAVVVGVFSAVRVDDAELAERDMEDLRMHEEAMRVAQAEMENNNHTELVYRDMEDLRLHEDEAMLVVQAEMEKNNYTISEAEMEDLRLAAEFADGKHNYSMSVEAASQEGLSSVVPAVIRLQTTDRYHQNTIVGIYGHKHCDGTHFGVRTDGERSTRMWQHPSTFNFAVEPVPGHSRRFKLRETSVHHQQCYLGVCGGGCGGGGCYGLNCISGGSQRAFRYPTVIQWDISGSFTSGGLITLRNVYHGSCYLGACGHFAGGFGMSCCTPSSHRSRTYTDLRTFKVTTPGAPVGKWVKVGSHHQSYSKEPWTFSFKVGKTTTNSQTLSASVSATLTKSLSKTVGFAAPAGPTASATATVEVSVTASMSSAYSSAVSKSVATDMTKPCGAPAGQTAWLWQWVVEVPTWDGNRPVTASVRSTETVCLHGNGLRRPVCALGRNKDADYSKCF